MKFNRTWDLKVSKEMIDFYNLTKKNGNNYFWNFNREKAIQLVKILSETYQVSVPKVVTNTKHLNDYGKKWYGGGVCGMYYYKSQTIIMRTRNHLKTIIHEFYHHLDNMTNGMYNSSDELRYAHMFAEKMYSLIRTGKITHTVAKKQKVRLRFIKKKKITH